MWQLNAYRDLASGTYEIWKLGVAFFDRSPYRRLSAPLLDQKYAEDVLTALSMAVTEGRAGTSLPKRAGEGGTWQCGYRLNQAERWPAVRRGRQKSTA